MVGRSYLLEKPAPPSAGTRFVNQRALPAVIDGVAALEFGLNQAAIAARKNPLLALAAAAAFGGLLALLLGRRRAVG